MNTFFGRFQCKSTSPLESELRAGRPQPPAQLVQKIVGTVENSQPRRSAAGLRLGFAGGLSALLVAGLAATGGVVYAATAIVHAASSATTHVNHPVSTGQPAAMPLAATSACTQYGQAPVVTYINPSAGFIGQKVNITGSHFGGQSRVGSVIFSPGVAATFRIYSNSHILAWVPNGAKTGGITVGNCKGSSTSRTFTVYKKHICRVPYVVGMSLPNAKAKIVAGGCKVGQVQKQPHRGPHTYHVYKQSPRAGTQLIPPGWVNLKAR